MSGGSSPPRLTSLIPRELVPAFEAEVAQVNQRRLRNLLPIFTLGHLLHVAAFYTSGAQRSQLDMRALVPNLPMELETLVNECLQRDPTRRPSARIAAQTLDRYADAHGTPSLERLEHDGRVCDIETMATPPALTLRSLPARRQR